MRGLTFMYSVALALLVVAPAVVAQEFDPGFESLVVVNISAPERVETIARMRAGAITAHMGPHQRPVESHLTEMRSRQLAGRAPRWCQFTLEPCVLDSIVVDWSAVEVFIDEEWQSPVVEARATSLVLGRRVSAGEVLVLNLRWDPDVQAPTAPDWQPSISIEEFVEPPLGARLYVSEEASGIVAVHERVRGRMVRGLPTGGQPRDMVWDPLRQKLYVAVAGLDELQSINAIGRETISRIPLSFGADPTRVLLSADRQRIAVLAPGRDMLFLFSAASLQELAKVRVGRLPVAMAEDPQSGFIYVTSRTSGQVDVVDPSVGQVVTTFTHLDSPAQIIRLASGRFAVGQYRGRRIEVIDPISGAVQSSIDLCGPADGLLFVQRLDRVYAVNNFCEEISILRPEQGLEMGAIRLDQAGGLPSLSPRESEIYLPLPGSSVVLVLLADQAADGREIDTGPGPWRVVAP